MNNAIILAAGSGTRMGASLPKQFLLLAGKPVLLYSVETFQENCNIDEIAIVCQEQWLPKVKEMTAGFSKVRKYIIGGKERFQSSLAAISAFSDSNCMVLIHDAARPLVSHRIINDCVDALQHGYKAVNVAVPLSDTIFFVDDQGFMGPVPARALLRHGQSPQGFHLGTLKAAYEIALNDLKFTTTDDCGVIQTYLPENKIFLVEGDMKNIKLTYEEDLALLEKYLIMCK